MGRHISEPMSAGTIRHRPQSDIAPVDEGVLIAGAHGARMACGTGDERDAHASSPSRYEKRLAGGSPDTRSSRPAGVHQPSGASLSLPVHATSAASSSSKRWSAPRFLSSAERVASSIAWYQ